jgi:hypothetical protein
MADAFQSQPAPRKTVTKARVEIVKPGAKSEAPLSGESINAVAMAFLKQLKRARVKSEGA